MSTFGDYVRGKRQARDISLTDFAKGLGISPAYWSRIETGREHAPKDELIRKAAVLLNVSEDELFVEAARLPPDMQSNVAEVVRLYRKAQKK